MTALLECPLDSETQQPLLPPEPIEDEESATACTHIDGHEAIEQSDPVLGTRYVCCMHCGDAMPWARDYIRLPEYFGGRMLRGAW